MSADYYEDESITIYYKNGEIEHKELRTNKCYGCEYMLEIDDAETDDIVQLIIDKKNNESEDECIFKDAKWRCKISTINLIKSIIKNMSSVDKIIFSRYYYV